MPQPLGPKSPVSFPSEIEKLPVSTAFVPEKSLTRSTSRSYILYSSLFEKW